MHRGKSFSNEFVGCPCVLTAASDTLHSLVFDTLDVLEDHLVYVCYQYFQEC